MSVTINPRVAGEEFEWPLRGRLMRPSNVQHAVGHKVWTALHTAGDDPYIQSVARLLAVKQACDPTYLLREKPHRVAEPRTDPI
jgi:hypothetical protein